MRRAADTRGPLQPLSSFIDPQRYASIVLASRSVPSSVEIGILVTYYSLHLDYLPFADYPE